MIDHNDKTAADVRKAFLFGIFLGMYAVKYGEFTLKSGKQSDIYADIRSAALNPRCLPYLRECILDVIGNFVFDSIGCDDGPAPTMILGSILGNWCVDHPIPSPDGLRPSRIGDPTGYVVRKEVKEHGTKKTFEGEIGTTPVFIEDVTTTGESAKATILKLPRKPILVVSVVDRQEGAKELFASMHMQFRSIFTLDLLRNWRNR